MKAKILLRALAYDRKLTSRVGDSVTVALVFSEASRVSREAKGRMLEAFTELGKLTFLSLPMRVTAYPYTDETKLKTLIADTGVDVLFVCEEMSDAVTSIISVARASQVATITDVPDYVRKGVALGVSMQGKNPQLLVNLPASKAEGMSLSAELMRIAEVIRD